MRKTNYKSGFTLIELSVAIAIIAVLITVATFGITTALRASRDSVRRGLVQDMVSTYTDIVANGTNPSILCPIPSTNPTALNFDSSSCSPPYLAVKDIPIKSTFTSASAISDSCKTMVGPETSNSKISICFDIDNHLIGILVEGSTTPYTMPF